MISIEDRALFEKAEAKARQLKPRVTVIKFGEYAVQGSKEGSEYTVKFTRDLAGHWAASCTCPAHVADGRADYTPKPCYHIPSAYSVHKTMVYRRQQTRELENPLPVCGCGANAFAHLGGQWYCIDCIKDMQAKEALTCPDCQAPATSESGRCYDCQLAKDTLDLFG